jgi:hypothetical protein
VQQGLVLVQQGLVLVQQGLVLVQQSIAQRERDLRLKKDRLGDRCFFVVAEVGRQC